MSKLSKIILVIITIAVMLSIATTSVYAEGGLLDFNSLTGEQTKPTDDNVPDLGSSIKPPTGETTEETTTGNTSKYEDSNIPYAGPEDTILMVSAFIVFGIIGVYTFIKMSEYSNI